MSDIIKNANRYNTSNTFRSDGGGQTRGNYRKNDGASIGFDCSGLVYHILRESGYDVPYAPSSVMVSAQIFSGNWATPVNSEVTPIRPGTLVYFNGHVGIVQSYDANAKTGKFLSMTGSNNVGLIKPDELFTTDPKKIDIYWGGQRSYKGFAEVDPNLYDRALDQHANGANPDKAVFNIPEAANAGFITLPNNGGFSINKSATDISTRADVLAAINGITPPPPLDLPNANTAFATALAVLESRGQPNDGYGAWLQDKQG
ncbi:MAG: NlpC/P60 family protein, partial [Burkholderiaceae bacterium]|nr:NlpC/P60 family protein [Burkholderiaceae bacterium]